jgi:hypothetical protein
MTTRRWRFSMRSLLLLMALLSVILAVAVNVPELVKIVLLIAAPVLVVIAILQSANYATSDHRPRLATFSWTLLAVFFVLFSALFLRVHLANALLSEDGTGWLWIFAVMVVCGFVSMYRACRSFMQIRRS